MPTVIKKLDAGSYQLKDQVVSINRVTKVVKGGKNLSFAEKCRKPSVKELSRPRRTWCG